jgi:hypothetical protein
MPYFSDLIGETFGDFQDVNWSRTRAHWLRKTQSCSPGLPWKRPPSHEESLNYKERPIVVGDNIFARKYSISQARIVSTVVPTHNIDLRKSCANQCQHATQGTLVLGSHTAQHACSNPASFMDALSGSWAHPGTRTGFRSPKKTAKFYFGTRPRPTGKSRPPKREGRRGRGKQEELAGLGFPPPPPRCCSRFWWSAPRASRSLGLTGRSTSRSVTSSTTTPCEPPFLPFCVDWLVFVSAVYLRRRGARAGCRYGAVVLRVFVSVSGASAG